MSILSFQNLAKYFGAQDVFAGLSASIAQGDKVALVGPNGAGKTTLIEILLGRLEPTEGQVQRARNLRVGYLPQHPEIDSEHTVYDEMLGIFQELIAQQERLQALMQEMADSPNDQSLIERYAAAEHRFDANGGYTYELAIRQVLSGLGFRQEMYDWPISVLSGGQVTRALLAKLLLQEPGLLILDEPTNYLDLAALEWLESYLQGWKQSLLIISHDRFFLDRVVSRVWELHHGRLATYRGNYSSFVEQRKGRLLRQQREYKRQQAEIAETEEFIRRNLAGQRTRQAQGRRTRLERMERLAAPDRDHSMHLGLNTSLRSGDKVLMCEQVTIGYPQRPQDQTAPEDDQTRTGPFALFEGGPFLMQRGDRVAFLGPNGCGKTTFIKTLLGQIDPLEGGLRIGASVRIGYLPQKQDWLRPEATVLDHLLDHSNYTVEQARTLLGRYLFTGEDVHKKIGVLSGGELARVALATLSIDGANLLVLDEPTTHLDVASQEILQEVLLGFPGTILLVSHDRYLIDAMATHIYWVEDQQLHTIKGNYSEWVAMRREQAEHAKQTTDKTDATDRKAAHKQRRAEQLSARRHSERVETLEQDVERLEQEIDAVSRRLDKASAKQDIGLLSDLGREYQSLQHALDEKLHAWEALVGD